MKVDKLAGYDFGAIVRDFKLKDAYSEEEVQELKSSLYESGLLIFKNVSISPPLFEALARVYGELEYSRPVIYQVEGHENIGVISNVVKNGKKVGFSVAGYYWHTDGYFLEKPAMATLLYCEEAPEKDGQTLFASAAIAYESLSDEIKLKLDALKGFCPYSEIYHRLMKSRGLNEFTEEERKKYPDITHPLVRTHPITKRKALYLNEMYLEHIEGMNKDESKALLEQLYHRATLPERIYTHQWEVSDLVIWDNATMIHKAVAPADGSHKTILRITVKGDVPY